MNNPLKPAAIITGGGRGLGRTIAETLSETHKILIVGRTESDLVSTCNDIRENSNEAEYIVGDISKSDTAIQVVNKVHDLGWNVSALINNAGIGKSGKTHEIDLQEWQATIETNLNGSFYMSREILPLLLQNNKGSIIFISSVAGLEGYSHEASYVASKHAQVGLSKVIAKEYDKFGIMSVALCPGYIEGEMTERTIQGVIKRKKISYDEARRVVASKNPQGRILGVVEVAEVVSDICNGRSTHQNGIPYVFEGAAV